MDSPTFSVTTMDAETMTHPAPEPQHSLFGRTRMILCEHCGNKRCPKASYHGYKCTGSNEPGQTPELIGDCDGLEHCNCSAPYSVTVSVVEDGEGDKCEVINHDRKQAMVAMRIIRNTVTATINADGSCRDELEKLFARRRSEQVQEMQVELGKLKTESERLKAQLDPRL